MNQTFYTKVARLSRAKRYLFDRLARHLRLRINCGNAAGFLARTISSTTIESASVCGAEGRPELRKLIAFDDDTFDKLKQLSRDRMATFQELADEAFCSGSTAFPST